jgi:hypothetical protein
MKKEIKKDKKENMASPPERNMNNSYLYTSFSCMCKRKRGTNPPRVTQNFGFDKGSKCGKEQCEGTQKKNK